MTPRFEALLNALSERDAGFVSLFGLAAMVVIPGILIEFIVPAKWQRPALFLWAVSAWGILILTTVISLIGG